MPLYEYYCESCEHSFEELLNVSKRDEPLKKPCTECGEKKIKKGISVPITGADATITLEKMCPGFSKKMEKISNSPVVNRAAKRNMMAAANMKPHGHLRQH
jgi:putative FmdB family regulatory protein